MNMLLFSKIAASHGDGLLPELANCLENYAASKRVYVWPAESGETKSKPAVALDTAA